MHVVDRPFYLGRTLDHVQHRCNSGENPDLHSRRAVFVAHIHPQIGQPQYRDNLQPFPASPEQVGLVCFAFTQ